MFMKIFSIKMIFILYFNKIKIFLLKISNFNLTNFLLPLISAFSKVFTPYKIKFYRAFFFINVIFTLWPDTMPLIDIDSKIFDFGIDLEAKYLRDEIAVTRYETEEYAWWKSFFDSISKIDCNSYSHTTSISFENPKTGIMLGIMELYDYIMFFLVLIFLVVMIFLVVAVKGSADDFLYNTGWNDKKIPFIINYISNSDYTFKRAHAFEFYWTILPGLLLIAMAYPSFVLLYSIDELVQPVYTVTVSGNQWYWTYEYNDFNLHIIFEDFIKKSCIDPYIFYKKVELLEFLPRHFAELSGMDRFILIDSVILSDENLPKGYPRLLSTDQVLVLPIDVPLRILITSNDVIHSWAVPSLGVKMDAVPGRVNQISLLIPFSGSYWGQCSELCGVNHGFMPIEIRAMEKAEFLEFISLNAKSTILPYLKVFDTIFNHPSINLKIEEIKNEI